MRLALAFLTLMALALPAQSATYWVRDSQSGAHTGADSSNAISLAAFNGSAVAGDVALLVGTFTTSPNPTNSGTLAAPIVYRGWSPGNQASATFSGSSFYFASTAPDSNVLYRDFKATTNGTSIGYYRGTTDPQIYARYRFKNITFTAPIVRFDVVLCDSRFDSCTFNAQQFIYGAGNYHDMHNYALAQRDSLIDCVANIAHDGSNAEANSGPSFNVSSLTQQYWKRLRVNDAISASGTKGMLKIYYLQRSLIEDSYFDLSSTRDLTGPACDECNTSYWRDSTQYNNWNRDTLYWHSAYKMAALMNASGSLSNSNRGNHFDSCLFVRSAPSGGTGPDSVAWSWYDTATASDSITNCVFINGDPLSMPIEANLWGAAAVFDHNTVVNLGTASRSRQASWNTMSGAAKITNNIFYSDSAAVARGMDGSALVLDAGTAAAYSGNTNLFYSANASSGSIYSGGVSYSPGSGGSQCATFGEECASRRGNPFFVGGATPITFDASLTAGSAARFGSDGYVGARSFSDGSSYTITVTQTAHGSISPSGVVSVASGANQTFTIAPDLGYHITAVTVDGSGVGTSGTYQFTNITANHTITATYAIDTNNITSSAGANGTISPSGTTAVNYGANQTYTFTPSTNYYVLAVTVDGVAIGAPSSYTFYNVTAAHTISVTFSATQFNLYAQAYPGGSISPSGTITVNAGDTQAFTITPNSGYVIGDVLVNGASVGTPSTYTMSNIGASASIEAYFGAISSYLIAVMQSTGGTISPAGEVYVVPGTDQTFTITPNVGYYVRSLVVDGVPITAARSYTFTNVRAIHTITATFASSASDIYLFGGTGGSIYPSGLVPAINGSRSFNVIPKPFRRVKSVKVNGVEVGPVTSFTLTNVVNNTDVVATFTDSAGGGRANWRRRR